MDQTFIPIPRRVDLPQVHGRVDYVYFIKTSGHYNRQAAASMSCLFQVGITTESGFVFYDFPNCPSAIHGDQNSIAL